MNEILNSTDIHVEYATIDFETTGVRAEGDDRAIQMAIIHSDSSGNITKTWSSYFNPQRQVGAVEIHGIQQHVVDAAPLFEHLAEEILELLENRVVVAHNVSFDLRFLKAEFARLGRTLNLNPINTLCTMSGSKTILNDVGSTRLSNCLEHVGIEFDGDAHDAEVDAVATAKLLQHYINTDSQALYAERVKRVVLASKKK